jgi:methylmalonyl-CoA mutase
MSKTALATLPEAEALDTALATWRKTVENELKGAPFDKKLLTKTFEGITLKPLYTRADLAGRELRPGSRRTGRGVWEVAQEIAAATAEEFNAKLREDLMGGQNAVVLRMDTPARPEGLPLEAPGVLEAALKDVEIAAIPVHINTGADASKASGHYIALANLRGVDGSSV